jgi:hypothetical protein
VGSRCDSNDWLGQWVALSMSYGELFVSAAHNTRERCKDGIWEEVEWTVSWKDGVECNRVKVSMGGLHYIKTSNHRSSYPPGFPEPDPVPFAGEQSTVDAFHATGILSCGSCAIRSHSDVPHPHRAIGLAKGLCSRAQGSLCLTASRHTCAVCKDIKTGTCWIAGHICSATPGRNSTLHAAYRWNWRHRRPAICQSCSRTSQRLCQSSRRLADIETGM